MTSVPEPVDASALPFVAPCRPLDTFAALRWLRLAWADFRAAPRQSLSYGLVVVLLSWTLAWITIRFGYGIESRGVVAAFAVFCVLFPMFFFRYARALWLALDCRFESNAFFDVAAPAASNQTETGAANERIPG